MKKRKILVALLSLVLILSTFGGCTQSKLRAYSAYHESDKIWTEYKSTYTPPSEASVTFNGVTYAGTYSGPMLKHLYQTYSYEGAGVSFQVDANGRLCQLSLDHQENKTCTFDESRWRKVADEVAENYISLDTYQVRYVVNKDPHLHEYRYERDIGSDRSVSDIIIRMNCSGEVCYFDYALEFENVRSVDADEGKVQKAVDKYMSKNKEFSRWEIRATALFKTSSNQCAVYCSVWPYSIDIDGNERSWAGFGLVVIVDHEKYDPSKP